MNQKVIILLDPMIIFIVRFIMLQCTLTIVRATAKPGIPGPGYSYTSPNYPTMRFLIGYYSVLFLIITVVLALFKNVTTVIKVKN